MVDDNNLQITSNEKKRKKVKNNFKKVKKVKIDGNVDNNGSELITKVFKIFFLT